MRKTASILWFRISTCYSKDVNLVLCTPIGSFDTVTENFAALMQDASARIVDLEIAITHLQHDLEQMNSVVLAIQAELLSSREHVSRLERRLTLAVDVAENRDPQEERPPHY